MGFNRRYGGDPRTPPAWAATVGTMKASGAHVAASCGTCGYHKTPLDLDRLIRERGEGFSLWDRRPKCPQPGCTGRILFLYSGSAATPTRPCRSER